MTSVRGGGGLDVPYALGAMHAITSTMATSGSHTSACRVRGGAGAFASSAIQNGMPTSRTIVSGDAVIARAMPSQAGADPTTCGTIAAIVPRISGSAGRANMKSVESTVHFVMPTTPGGGGK